MFDALIAHHARVKDRPILSLFDEARAESFSVEAEGMLLD
jgi:hypothetical protein